MRSRFAIVLLLVTTMLSMPVAVEARQDPACDGMDAYLAAMTAAGEQFAAAMPESENNNLDSWTPEDFTAASEAFDSAQELFAAIEPPAIAEEYHALLLEQFDVLSQMFGTMATVGIFGALMFAEQMSELDADVEAASQAVESACGIQLDDEVGSELDSGSATPSPVADGQTDDFFGTVAEAGSEAVPVPGTPESEGAERSR